MAGGVALTVIWAVVLVAMSGVDLRPGRSALSRAGPVRVAPDGQRRRRRGGSRTRRDRRRDHRGRPGLRVVCVDKATFPRDKTCGDGLTANALRLLEALGVDLRRVRRDRTWRVHETVIVSPSGRRVDLPLPADGLHAAVVPRRDTRRGARRRRARAGASRCARGMLSTRCPPSTTSHVVDDGLEAPYVIAADGHWSPVRRAFEPDAPRDLGEWHAVRQYFDGVDDDRLWVLFERDLLPGYAWVFPLPGGRANVGYGVLRADGRSGRELEGAVA